MSEATTTVGVIKACLSRRLMGSACCVCRWTGSITIPADGLFSFAVGADAGALLKIDGGNSVVHACTALPWQLTTCSSHHPLLHDGMLSI